MLRGPQRCFVADRFCGGPGSAGGQHAGGGQHPPRWAAPERLAWCCGGTDRAGDRTASGGDSRRRHAQRGGEASRPRRCPRWAAPRHSQRGAQSASAESASTVRPQGDHHGPRPARPGRPAAWAAAGPPAGQDRGRFQRALTISQSTPPWERTHPAGRARVQHRHRARPRQVSAAARTGTGISADGPARRRRCAVAAASAGPPAVGPGCDGDGFSPVASR